jgi:hypothetical protein
MIHDVETVVLVSCWRRAGCLKSIGGAMKKMKDLEFMRVTFMCVLLACSAWYKLYGETSTQSEIVGNIDITGMAQIRRCPLFIHVHLREHRRQSCTTPNFLNFTVGTRSSCPFIMYSCLVRRHGQELR